MGGVVGVDQREHRTRGRRHLPPRESERRGQSGMARGVTIPARIIGLEERPIICASDEDRSQGEFEREQFFVSGMNDPLCHPWWGSNEDLSGGSGHRVSLKSQTSQRAPDAWPQLL